MRHLSPSARLALERRDVPVCKQVCRYVNFPVRDCPVRIFQIDVQRQRRVLPCSSNSARCNTCQVTNLLSKRMLNSHKLFKTEITFATTDGLRKVKIPEASFHWPIAKL